MTPADVAELNQLYADWPAVRDRIMTELTAEPPAYRVTPESRTRLAEAELAQLAIRQ